MKLNSIWHSLPHGLLSENSLCGTVYGGKICVYCYSLRIQAAHICGGVGLGDGNSVTFRGLKCHSKFFSNSWKNPSICNWIETERCFGKKGSRTRQPQIKQTKNFKCHCLVVHIVQDFFAPKDLFSGCNKHEITVHTSHICILILLDIRIKYYFIMIK